MGGKATETRNASESCDREALVSVARQGGLEPPTDCLEGNCSIRLSYWRAKWKHSLFFPAMKVKSCHDHFQLLPLVEPSMNSLRIASPVQAQ